jgi:hypothetical protein
MRKIEEVACLGGELVGKGSMRQQSGERRLVSGHSVGCWLVIAICLCVRGWCQEPPAGLGGGRLPGRFPDMFREGAIQPDAVFLRNAAGEAIFVPSVTYEEFERYLKERRGAQPIPPPPPPFSLAQLAIELTVHENYAEIEVRAELQQPGEMTEPLRVPLRLSGLHLTAPAQLADGQPAWLTPVSAGNGYVWWWQPDAGEPRELVLRGVCRLQEIDGRPALSLDLPEGPSVIRARLPASAVDVQVTAAGSEVLERQLSDAAQLVTVRGSGGPHLLHWQLPGEGLPLQALELTSSTRLLLDATNQLWRVSSELTLLGGESGERREFIVRLPPGALWTPSPLLGDEGGYIVSRLPDEPSASVDTQAPPAVEPAPRGNEGPAVALVAGAEALGPRLRISLLAGPVTDELQVRLDWQQPLAEVGEQGGVFEPPMVEGVATHRGRLELVVPAELRLLWQTSPGMRWLQQSVASQTPASLQYNFAFDAASGRLSGRLIREGTQQRVRPTYAVRVAGRRMRLAGVLEFITDPLQLPNMEIELGDWEIETLETAGGREIAFTLSSPGVVRPHLESLIADEVSGLGSRRGLSSIQLTAVLDGEPSPELPMRFELPKVWFTSEVGQRLPLEQGAGTLAVSPEAGWRIDAASVQLEGLLEETQLPGLVREWLSPGELERATGFRFAPGGGPRRWSGLVREQIQRLSSAERTLVELRQGRVVVDQQWQVSASHGGVAGASLIWSEPTLRALIESDSNQLTVYVNQQPTPLRVIDDISDAASEQRLGRASPSEGAWSVALLTDELPPDFELRLVWSLPLALTAEEFQRELALPLASLNLGGPVVRTFRRWWRCDPELEFLPANIRLESGGERFSGQPSAADRMEGELATAAVDEPVWTPFLLVGDEPVVRGSLIRLGAITRWPVTIERVWIQTALSNNQRRDRFVVRFRTSQELIQLRLPFSLANQPTDVALNGRRIELSGPVSDGGYVLDLRPPAAGQSQALGASREQVLEIWTWSDSGRPEFGRLRLEPLRIVGADETAAVIWQVLMPPTDHLVLATGEVLPEYGWSWTGSGWARRSDWTQESLEGWSGASRQNPLGTQVNSYVLSSWAIPERIDLLIAPRYLIWLPIGVVIVFGTLIWQLSASWFRPVLAAVGFGALLAVALAWPDLGVMAAQLLLVGIVLVVVYRLVEWVVRYRASRRSVFTTRIGQSERRPADGSYRGRGAVGLSTPTGVGSSMAQAIEDAG